MAAQTSAIGLPVGADASQSTVVADLVHQLEPRRREAFVLTQVIGMTYDEAAALCNCPPKTIASRVARARAQLFALMHGAEKRPPGSFNARRSTA